ncbi:MAG: hypothetical protein L0Y72_22060 [Gemmataceae bacterium]|nr:hypothetical protein [Gemmataceae bacterium]MCI0741727.1 hypothetical protein [Gemmataceae bacterium]
MARAFMFFVSLIGLTLGAAALGCGKNDEGPPPNVGPGDLKPKGLSFPPPTPPPK